MSQLHPKKSLTDRRSCTPASTARQRAGALGVTWLILGAIATGCGPADPGPTLTISVEGPPGVDPEILVTGPNKFSTTIRKGSVLSRLPEGEYNVRIADRRTRVPQAVVDAVWSGVVVGSPARVTARGAKVEVRFGLEPASGRLWVPLAAADRVVAFSDDELVRHAAPGLELAAPKGSSPDAVAFDPRGNMWVALSKEGRAILVPMDELGSSKVMVPSKTITNLDTPQGMAFDARGDLWICAAGSREVVHYGDVVYGTPTRRRAIRVDGTPRAVAFDAAGNLLVSLRDPAGVALYAAATLTASNPAPRALLRGVATGLTRPSGLAFDATGSLWITQDTGPGALRYDAAFISAMMGEVDAPPTGSVAPPAGGTFHGLAFANAGAGWLSAEVAGKNALSHVVDMASATPTFAGTVGIGEQAAGIGLGMPAFNPASKSLPIRR